MEKNSNQYTLFIDESGVASLNHKGQFFILSCILIRNEDIPIIQGYFKLLKREYFKDENKVIHCTDLFERPYQNYRRLILPKDRRNSFLARILETIKIVPFHTGIYYINKDILRAKLNYKPYIKKKDPKLNFDLPYELLARNAILDFTLFLKQEKVTGEIIIESRQFNDQLFVGYFDDVRKKRLAGNIENPYATLVTEKINSLSIANKNYTHIGLELADMCAYTMYRKLSRDLLQRMKLPLSVSDGLHGAFRNKSFVAKIDKVIKVRDIVVANVKPSKLI